MGLPRLTAKGEWAFVQLGIASWNFELFLAIWGRENDSPVRIIFASPGDKHNSVHYAQDRSWKVTPSGAWWFAASPTWTLSSKEEILCPISPQLKGFVGFCRSIGNCFWVAWTPVVILLPKGRCLDVCFNVLHCPILSRVSHWLFFSGSSPVQLE